MLCEAAHIMLVRVANWRWLKAWAMKIARLLAEAMLDNVMLKDIATKNGDVRGEAGSCGAPV